MHYQSTRWGADQVDIHFSCVDSYEGYQIADLIAQAFMIPLIDMGATIPTRRLADAAPATVEVMGRIDYVQPGTRRSTARFISINQTRFA